MDACVYINARIIIMNNKSMHHVSMNVRLLRQFPSVEMEGQSDTPDILNLLSNETRNLLQLNLQ